MLNKGLYKFFLAVFGVLYLLVSTPDVFAVETAPRITDREIVERLSRLEEGQKNIEKRMDDLRSEMNNRFNDLNQRFTEMQWMIGLFITIALAIFAAMGKILWNLSRKQTAQEKIIQNLSGENEFLKQTDLKLMDQIKVLIETLKPPRGVL